MSVASGVKNSNEQRRKKVALNLTEAEHMALRIEAARARIDLGEVVGLLIERSLARSLKEAKSCLLETDEK